MNWKHQTVLVCGAGGFIGGHLVKALLRLGPLAIRAIDIKPLADWFQVFPEADNLSLDLSKEHNFRRAVDGMRAVFQLAADMGGMGFIELNKARCMLNSLITTNMLLASSQAGVERFFFPSSACVYNADKQKRADVLPLREEDAYPAMPEDGYGWEKLFSERMCRHFEEDFGLQCRIARYHNVYGPHGSWSGGREKAPAAICRKVLEAKISGQHDIEIWGDGTQTRSFMYIDDCIRGTLAIMESDIHEPVNLGSAELVTIDQLVTLVQEIAEIKLARHYDLNAPHGVAGRNSDNSRLRRYLGWEPSVSLNQGLAETYAWIESQMAVCITT